MLGWFPLVLGQVAHNLLCLLRYSLCSKYRVGKQTLCIGICLARSASVAGARPSTSAKPSGLICCEASTALASRRFALAYVMSDMLGWLPLVLGRVLHHLLCLLSYSLCDKYRIAEQTVCFVIRRARCAWVCAAPPRAGASLPTLFGKLLAV